MPQWILLHYYTAVPNAESLPSHLATVNIVHRVHAEFEAVQERQQGQRLFCTDTGTLMLMIHPNHR